MTDMDKLIEAIEKLTEEGLAEMRLGKFMVPVTKGAIRDLMRETNAKMLMFVIEGDWDGELVGYIIGA